MYQVLHFCVCWSVSVFSRAVGKCLIALVGVYQVVISPLLGNHCRFQPSCSRYFQESVTKYGPIQGTWKGIVRICRCHPWNRGGYDPP
ncbi:MAG: membrane protein insertion efficiency factor YidD [Planctomycetaceae bacterium]|nr:membrane protein insertion efficiency factor YidD [Planctomycetaceae bacterium]MBT4885588.1 membrane protein insertion efficiency factor YidD [Planctomycetaceae bacterium]MBT6054011.1 membrane protein insertion efficiency factor YidD [Planctomycetaceae bacterium]MBT6458885.1 membrane protein insertion efficiency factor YidD [Planctomycetaceae bacterium]MBT6641639.1 membrane protein insertion efficiency factor YidD [Planctomycetaceae bacterium]